MGAHIAGCLAATAARDGDRPLFFCQGRITTTGQAAARVAALATALQQRLGVQLGERVCLAALATDQSLEALLAITAAGAVAAPLNWRWSAAEAAFAVDLVDASVILADAACVQLALELAARCPSVRAVVLLGAAAAFAGHAALGPQPRGGNSSGARPPPRAGAPTAFAECLMAEGPASGGSPAELRAAPGGAALVVFTSGSTGRPKAAVLSHAALHAQSMAKLLVCGYSRADVYLHAAPLFHIGGISSALAMLLAGAAHVFLPRFDPAAALALMAAHRVTSFIAVPAMVADLVAAAAAAPASGAASPGAQATGGQAAAPLPSMRRVLLGGGGTAPELLHALALLFPAATVQSAYGMTEAASSITFRTEWTPCASEEDSTATARAASSNADSPVPSTGTAAAPRAAGAPEAAGGACVGEPPPGIEVAVLQPPAGTPEPPGATPGAGAGAAPRGAGRVALEGAGEVVTRGPHTMLGYWADEGATAATMLPGGWMRTGDLGHLSQGRLWLLGRAKDMIKSGGENVHAWEVERALGAHPAVAAAAVVGVSDWRLGEAVAAAVVLAPGWAWRGARCQSLLRRPVPGAGGPAAALAAAAGALGGGAEQPAEGGDDGRVRCADDLGSTLRKEQPSSRPGSSQSVRGDGGGGLLAALPPHDAPAGALLRRVAAGLEAAATRLADGGGAGGGAGSADGGGSSSLRQVDGRALQQHCRDAGLAGFKLPRAFLHCAAAALGGDNGGLPVLPVTSTGKVAKHLLRELMAREMQAAASASGDAGHGRRRARL
eukprot:scaffold12.g8051.t1